MPILDGGGGGSAEPLVFTDPVWDFDQGLISTSALERGGLGGILPPRLWGWVGLGGLSGKGDDKNIVWDPINNLVTGNIIFRLHVWCAIGNVSF